MKTLLRLSLVAVFAVAMSSMASADPCLVTDNGGGTVTLPPVGCEYLSPDEVHMIIDGLPAGTTIELAPIHKDFICHSPVPGAQGCPPPGECEAAGGSLGGNTDCFDSQLELEAKGTGDLSTFNRTIVLPVSCQVHTGPRTPGQPVQSFDTKMHMLQGQISGDPDFDLLRVTAGDGFGLPSPGHTTLTQVNATAGTVIATNTYAVDSFFDITYRIDFVGASGSQLAGLSGSTTATIRMQTGTHAVPLPTTNAWGQILVSLLVLGTGIVVLQRRAFA